MKLWVNLAKMGFLASDYHIEWAVYNVGKNVVTDTGHFLLPALELTNSPFQLSGMG